MTTSEPGPVEREAELTRLRKQMRKAGRRGDAVVFERLSAEYAEAKAVHVSRSHEEQRERVRAQRVLEASVRASEGPWRLPRGFSSPLAEKRARTGIRPREEPPHPGRGLSPWRQESPMQRQIWRP